MERSLAPNRSSGFAPGFTRDFIELIFGYGLIVFVIWMPETPQKLLTPVALIVTLTIVLVRRQTRDELGFGLQGFVPSLWILPAALVVTMASTALSRHFGMLHTLYKGDLRHIAGYVLWTIYQQFLLNDYFMPRLSRITGSEGISVSLAGVLFAAAHLPNLWLTVATLAWGAISTALFLRYRNVYALGLAQGLLGLTFAVCVPESLSHHLRVGLGYLRYRQ
jgi:hypothetical protein